MGLKKLVHGPRAEIAKPDSAEAGRHLMCSEIKPCMAQHKLLHGETAYDSSEQLSLIGC